MKMDNEKEKTSTTQANMELNDRFYGKKKPKTDPAPPTYLQNSTPAIKITGNEE